jgi:hypothetical protein
MALKLCLARRNVPFPKVHDLDELRELALANGLLESAKIDLSSLPKVADAVRHRYFSIPPISSGELLTNYHLVAAAV